MTDTITPARFHDEVGVQDWRVLHVGPCAWFRTGSLTAGVAVVDAIVALAEVPGLPSGAGPAYRGCGRSGEQCSPTSNQARVATWMGRD